MTIRVERELRFSDLSRDEAVRLIDPALTQFPRWRVDDRRSGRWRLTHRPWNPLILRTHVELDLLQGQRVLIVRAVSVSQPFIFGDIFGMYPRLLDDLLRRVNEAVNIRDF
jgi:hypothetical protein